MFWRFYRTPRCKITGNRVQWCECLLHKNIHTHDDIEAIEEVIKELKALAKSIE